MRRVLGDEHWITLSARELQAMILNVRGEHERAEELYRANVEATRHRLGPGHPRLAPSLNNLAYTLKLQGDPAAAETHYRNALAILEDRFGDDHPDVVQVLHNLAAVVHDQGQIAETEEVLRRIVAATREAFPDDHWRLGGKLVDGLGEFLMRHDRCAEAVPALREGVGVWRRGLGLEHRWTRRAEIRLGACLSRLGRQPEGANLLESGLDGIRTSEIDRFDRQTLSQIADHLHRWMLFDESARLRALLGES